MLMIPWIAAALLAVPQQAADWRVADMAADFSLALVVDVDSVTTTEEGYKRAWVLMVKMGESPVFTGMNALSDFDCAGNRRRGIRGESYDADGKFVQDVGPEREWQPIDPGSLLGSAARMICQGATPATGSLGNATPPVRRVLELLALSRAAGKPVVP